MAYPKNVGKAVERLTAKHFLYLPSASIYGGVSGLYDYGPLGCKLKTNIINYWRNFFVLEENIFEIETMTLTPEIVLKTSGHVEKFEDLMVKDVITNECFRADHLIENHIDLLIENKDKNNEKFVQIKNNISGMDKNEITKILKDLKIVSPTTGNNLSEPYEFNLMFGTQIGPTGKLKGYLRPETAQGIFVNFKKLLEENGGKVPFAAAQIGNSYRNEISPKSGLLRVREFAQAEIEHFCDKNKGVIYPKYENITDEKVAFWKREDQENNVEPQFLSVKNAFEKKMITNQTLAFYIYKTLKFLLNIGINGKFLRFRQHLKNEMAHYASDCWDAEIRTSYGWIECVGLADRACYDLAQHAKASKVELSVYETFDKPEKITKLEIKLNKALIGKTFKTKSKSIIERLSSFTENEKTDFKKDFDEYRNLKIAVNNKEYKLEREMIQSIEQIETERKGHSFIPSVVEPSFGIGRILYSLLEHSLKERTTSETNIENEEKREFLSFNPTIAPIKCLLTSLSGNKELKSKTEEIFKKFAKNDIFADIDKSNASIGRKYVRSDERGVYLCVTIDFQSLKDSSFTIRYRDTMEQIRTNPSDGMEVIKQILKGEKKWKEIANGYGLINT